MRSFRTKHEIRILSKLIDILLLLSLIMLRTTVKAYERAATKVEQIHQGSSDGDPPISYLYEIPRLRKGPRAIALLFHGCAHTAFDWFNECDKCVGLPIERSIAHLLYEQNFAVLAISSRDGCWSRTADANRVYKALKDFIKKDGTEIGDLADKEHVDVYAFGASSGGSFVTQVLPRVFDDHYQHLKMRLKGVISQIAQPPETISVATVFAHMPKDARIAQKVKFAMEKFTNEDGPSVKESLLMPMKITEHFFRDNAGPARTYETYQSEAMYRALKENGFLGEDDYLIEDPRRSNWRDVLCQSDDPIAPDSPCDDNKSATSELMNVAWASHEMRFDTFAEDLKFLLQASHTGTQAVEFADEIDGDDDVDYHNHEEAQAPAPAPAPSSTTTTSQFNLMSGEENPTTTTTTTTTTRPPRRPNNNSGRREKPEFPEHWGPLPLRQTRDYRQFPPPYEEHFGSGTVVNWILKQQRLDKENPERAIKSEDVAVNAQSEDNGEGVGNEQQQQIEFPKRWGDPPEIQTMDYVELPPPYGHGSSTLRSWIEGHLRRDAEFRLPSRREKVQDLKDYDDEEVKESYDREELH